MTPDFDQIAGNIIERLTAVHHLDLRLPREIMAGALRAVWEARGESDALRIEALETRMATIEARLDLPPGA